jgi:hypothetical protein
LKVKYLINIVSLMRLEPHLGWIPECLFRRPNDLINDALEMGYGGVQAIPIRGLTGNESGIEMFEFAWNPVDSFLQAIRHQQGRSGEPCQIQDWVVSPKVEECCDVHNRLARRGIREIFHDYLESGWDKLVEVSPKLKASPTVITEDCAKRNKRLVLDTWHLRQQPSPFGSSEQEWFDAIDRFAPFVDVIHVNPGDDPKEMNRFLTDPQASITGRLLCHLLSNLDGKEDLIIVAEPRPILRGDGGIRQAKVMLSTLKSMIG